jgi:hypothetical protein
MVAIVVVHVIDRHTKARFGWVWSIVNIGKVEG